MRHTLLFTCLIVLGISINATQHARAQSYSASARALTRSARALAMGDAAAAYPTTETALSYNPAHLAVAATAVPQVTLLGVRGSVSQNTLRGIRFATTEAEPAVSRGMDNLTASELSNLYDKAWQIGGRRSYAGADLMLPSAVVRVGGAGLGFALRGHTHVLSRPFKNGGAGVPIIDATMRTDLMGTAGAGLDLSRVGLSGIQIGANATYTRRYLAIKHKLLDTFETDEGLYLLRGQSMAVSGGLLYQMPFVPVPGRLQLGLSVYDLIASPFSYEYDRTLAGKGGAQEAQPEIDEVNERYETHPAYRIGIAWTTELGPFSQTALAVDYLKQTRPIISQSVLTRLHAGIEAQVGRRLALRAGLNQGYTTAGFGLDMGLVEVSYAYFGVETGPRAGSAPSWNHVAEITARLN